MDELFIVSFETRLHCYMAGQKYMKEDSPSWHTACGLASDGLPREAESLCRLKKKLDKIIEENIHWGLQDTTEDQKICAPEDHWATNCWSLGD